LRVQSAISAAVTTITRAITVAAGVFAPGHLGELTWQVPFELADAVLEETRARERRLRDLPSRAGIYFVLALGLFPRAPGQHPQGQIPAVALEQGRPAPARSQHPGHRYGHHRPPPPRAPARDTPTTVLEHRTRALTTRHCG
jgi:hypothetical protein